MATELAWRTGFMGDQLSLTIDWYDHNNCIQQNEVMLEILNQDKPRTLRVRVDEREVFRAVAGTVASVQDVPTLTYQELDLMIQQLDRTMHSNCRCPECRRLLDLFEKLKEMRQRTP